MNEITVHELKNEMDYQIIHDSMSHVFQVEALKMYESEAKRKTPFRVPQTLLDGDGDFYEIAANLYGMALDSLMRLDFPRSRWDNFTQEEYEDYEEMLGNHPLEIEEVFLHDLELVLKSYQLFYLKVETYLNFKTKECKEEIVGVHNSPLQEVW